MSDAMLRQVDAYLDGELDAAGVAAVAAWLGESEANRALFLEKSLVHSRLTDVLGGERAEQAVATLIAEPADVAGRITPTRRAAWAVAAALLVAGTAAAIYLAALAGSASDSDGDPFDRPIAVMLDADGVVWHTEPVEAGDEFAAGGMSIEAGKVAFRLGGGAEVTITGPAAWHLSAANAVRLVRGTLRSVSTPGFTVHAPHGVRIVDLGTEFEATAIDGRLTVRVIDGAVDVVCDGSGATPARYRLDAGQRMALVDGAPAADLTIDLADIIGGGDGSGTGRDAGLRLIDGEPTTAHRENTTGPLPPVNRFIPAAHPLIDGVFVPDGGDGSAAIPVSSTGLSVTGIADGDGHSWDELWNGHNARTTASQRFDSVIGMHASKGVTFDLDAIRRAHPYSRFERFTATAALGDAPGNVTVYVAVDGSIRFTAPLGEPGATAPIDLPIPADARFLTLIAVSNGPDGSDWAFLGDASLRTAPRDTPDSQTPTP